MGVPKFFRYISERYPCLCELVKDYQIPQFDNLYLDMNGIIHVCSHPDDSNPHFRISEEKIFQDIFHYIEVLFRMIKPLKVFYMAVDGVAPRAKMNQQRSRRFRTAKDAEKAESKAKESGEVLPTDAKFDSNCITPGTEFMTKLHEQLKYFVVNKVSMDPLWQKCTIIFSGHETPGEGEHKIMEYIRHARSQPGYDPNTRHCLYGLDADLIMLGLCTHEPHFSLLREEVRFGKKSQPKRKNVPEYIKFYLLHLSLMREYLELEFKPVKESLSFAFDIEKIIDDWVLMGFLVGNDFIPNLPNMHINNGALPLLYEAYMKVLPTLDGYINEAGTLNLSRFQSFLDHLSKIDLEHFNETYVDLKYMEEKTGRRLNDSSKLEQFMSKFSMSPSFLNNTLNNLFPDLNLSEDSDDGGSDDLRTEYDDEQFKEEFKLHKRDYYMNKLDYEQVTPEVLKSQAEGYVRAIQWNLHYYYNGVCSWSWYYPHHYAPYISDIKNFSNVDFSFEIGEPFKPFEQLLAVLPPASKTLLPKCYHPLMTDDDSPLKKYYPAEFETDQNGKQQEWEAVVLVPFIEEDVLLKAMETCNKNLSLDELKRNRHGPMVIFKFTEKDLGEYEAPAHFPPIHSNHAEIELLHSIDVQVPKEKLIKGAYPGVKFDVYYPGFPTMKHLKYDGRLEKAKVKVFEQPSRNPSMMLIIQENENKSLELAVSELLGKTVFAGWPHLVEATVVSVSNEKYRYHAVKDGKYNVETNKGNMQDIWYSQVESFLEDSRNRMGIIAGNTNILVHVKLMTGRKCLFMPHGRITVEKQWSNAVYAFPLQTIVKDIACYNAVEVPYKNVEDLFPLGSYCFMLGQPHYGCIGKIIDSRESLKKGRLKTEMYIEQEPDFSMVWDLHKNLRISYMSLHDAAAKLGISKYLLSRLTGTILVLPDHMKDKKVRVGTKLNIGLNLKFNKKNEEIPGYTKKIGSIWYYSDKVISLMKSYMEKFPVIFGFLSANANRDDYYFNELFPGDSAQERVQEVANWISSQDYAKIDRKSCGLCVLEPEVIQHLQKTVDEFKAKKTPKKPVIMQVKPYLLYNSNVQSECLPPDPASTFELFDRVVNVRPGYTVPVGLTGTIIAIHKTADCNENDILYDILFDKEFAGGFDFGTSSCQGYRLTRFALINKSFGQRQFEQRTGKLSQQNPSVTNQRPSNTQSFGFAKQSALPQHNQGNSAFVSCWQNQKTPYNHQPQQQWRQTGSATQNLNDVANKTVPSRQINPIHNFFMPSFGSKPDKDVTENKQDTDLLKKVLGISSGSNEENKPSSSNQKVNTHATPKQHKITAASELTRYYQNKNWGVPQYQYYPLSKNNFICQIVTKDGNMLCSEPKRTKEEACENLAQKYIKFLETNNKCVDIKLPVPPPQWCQANTSAEKPSEKKKERNATVPPFVPLQAVRQQKQKQNRTVNKPQHTDEDNLNNSGENHETGCLHDNKLKQIGGEKVKNKRKRERKIRIAANFSNAMDN